MFLCCYTNIGSGAHLSSSWDFEFEPYLQDFDLELLPALDIFNIPASIIILAYANVLAYANFLVLACLRDKINVVNYGAKEDW